MVNGQWWASKEGNVAFKSNYKPKYGQWMIVKKTNIMHLNPIISQNMVNGW
jgi:hypothetical protein